MSRAEQSNREATDWLIAQEVGALSLEDQAKFDTWFAASEGNKAAFWRLEYGWAEADRVGALGRDGGEQADDPGVRRSRRWWVPAAIAASVALVVSLQYFTGHVSFPGAGGDASPEQTVARSYTTPVGGKRLVGLEDGSRIQLNTQSKLRALMGSDRREIWLDEGEAFFEIAHREDQPFIVHAGDRQITVLGTSFSVRRTGDKVVVAVLKGRVRVQEVRGNQLLESKIIMGGDIAMAEGAAMLVTARSEENVQNALSWRKGMLTFDEQPLPAIASEFNRYNEKKLVLLGQSVATIRITGTFPSDRPDAFARLLRDAYGLEVDDSASEIRVSR